MRPVIALSMLLICAVASAGEVYKWKDKNGVWHYGDRPTAGAEQVELKSDEEAAPSVAEADRLARDKECQAKKAQLDGWRQSTKLSEVDSLGREREYTKEERAQFMALQEKKMQEICARPPSPEAEGTFPPPPPAESPPPAPSEDAPSPSQSTY